MEARDGVQDEAERASGLEGILQQVRCCALLQPDRLQLLDDDQPRGLCRIRVLV